MLPYYHCHRVRCGYYTKVTPKNAEYGANGQTRTVNTLLFRQVLYAIGATLALNNLKSCLPFSCR